jgi:hypothetical protein
VRTLEALRLSGMNAAEVGRAAARAMAVTMGLAATGLAAAVDVVVRRTAWRDAQPGRAADMLFAKNS